MSALSENAVFTEALAGLASDAHDGRRPREERQHARDVGRALQEAAVETEATRRSSGADDPYATRCETCRQPAGAGCVVLDGPDGRPLPWPRKRPHAARVKAAGGSTTTQTPPPPGPPTCPYCGASAELVDGTVIYPHREDLATKRFWDCRRCDAYVGCHDGTAKPLGRLANKELRGMKMQAHGAFDPLWRSGEMGRQEAYAWLAEALGIPPEECHIGMMAVDRCRAVVAACKARAFARKAGVL